MKKFEKVLKLNLISEKNSAKKELEYIQIDNDNVIASSLHSAIQTNIQECFGSHFSGFEKILDKHRRIYIHCDEFKKIGGKVCFAVELLSENEKDIYLKFFLEKNQEVTIKATVKEFSFFQFFEKNNFFEIEKKEINSIAFNYKLLNNFNDCISSRASDDPTILNFSSKTDKILVKNHALKKTLFVLLPVRMNEN